MIELNRVVTFRITESEYKDLTYLVDGIQKIGKEKVIQNSQTLRKLDDIQKAKGRKGVNLSVADIIRLGCKILLSEYDDLVQIVRESNELSDQLINKRINENK